MAGVVLGSLVILAWAALTVRAFTMTPDRDGPFPGADAARYVAEEACLADVEGFDLLERG